MKVFLPIAATLVLLAAGCTTTVKESPASALNSAVERQPTERSEPPKESARTDRSPERNRGSSPVAEAPTTPRGGSTPAGGAAHGTDLEFLVELDGLLNQWVEAHNLANEGARAAAAERIRPLVAGNHDRLMGFLRGSDLEARTVASFGLGFSDRPEVIPALLAALRDSNPYVRSNAALSLGIIGSKEIPLDPLIALLQDSAPSVKASAAHAISRCAKRGDDRGAVTALIELLRDDSFQVRNEVVRALAVLGDRRATLPLVNTPLRDPYFLIRLNTAVALSRLRDPRAIEPLIRVLDDPDVNIHQAARFALAKITGAGVEDKNESWKAWWEINRERIARDILEGRGTTGTSEIDLGGGN